MKLAAGSTYREAVALKPITGIRKTDEETIKRIRENFKVVINYKKVQNRQVRYYWEFKGPYTFIVIDRNVGDYIKKEDDDMKVKYFKSIRKAMEWIYDHDKEYYDSLENLSLQK